MGMGTENHRSGWSSTEPRFALYPIHPALSRAEVAILENAVGLLDSLSQFALFFQFFIGWKPLLTFFLRGMKGGWGKKQ
jgi:hypothetical protein